MTEELLKIRESFGEKKQVSNMLYYTFKEAIATGIMKPGFRLKEEDLASIFQVSRTPIRETIKKLESEGLVSLDSSRGFIVRELKLDECLDTLEMLEWLRSAAIDFLRGRIPRNILMMLEANLHQGEDLTDPIQRYENNSEFHALLIRATGNTELINITSRLEFKERQIMLNIYSFTYVDNYIDGHRKLLTAILDDDKAYLQEYKDHNMTIVTEHMNKLISTFLQ